MPEEKYGIENIKKLIDIAIESGNVAGHWASPGGKGPAELLRLTDEVMALPTVDFKLIDDEVKDFSETEVLQLRDHVAQKLDIPQDKTEAIVEKALSMGIKLAGLVKDGFDLAKLVEASKA